MRKISRVMAICLALVMMLSITNIGKSYADGEADISDKVEFSNYSLYKGSSSGEAIIENGAIAAVIPELHVKNQLYVEFNWKISADNLKDANAGDYFYFQLLDSNATDAIELKGNDSGNIIDPNDPSKPLGTYALEADGRLKFTLSQNAIDKGKGGAGIDNGKFNAYMKISKEIQQYNIYVDKQTTIEVTLLPKETTTQGTKGIYKNESIVDFNKSGSPDNVNGFANWRFEVNSDQMDELFAKTAITEKKNVLIEDRIPKALTLDKNYLNIRSELLVPYIDGSGNIVLDPNGEPHKSTHSLGSKSFNKVDLTLYEPDPGESYDDFFNRMKTLNKTLNTLAYAIYDNPDPDSSAALLILFGNCPGTKTPDGSKVWTYGELYNGSIDNFYTNHVNNNTITQEQADAMKLIYGADTPVVRFNVNIRTTGRNSEYTNTATMYWGENESREKSRTMVLNQTGAFAEVKPFDITVNKVWDDTKDHSADTVSVRLYNNGQQTDKVIELNHANSFTAKFTGLYGFVNGEQAVYTVKEENVPADYEPEYSGDVKNGFTITNKVVDKIKVEKQWVENDGQVKDHDEVIVLKILKKNSNDEFEDTGDTVELKKDSDPAKNWKAEFSVPKGKAADYKLEEVAVTGYESKVTYDDTSKTFTIVNTEYDNKTTSSSSSSSDDDDEDDDNKDDKKEDNKDDKKEDDKDDKKEDDKDDKKEDDKDDKKDDPAPKDDKPTYTINNLPDPNDVNTPDEIEVVGEDGEPLGKYTKKITDGENEWVAEDGTVLGNTTIPQTGDKFPVLPLALILVSSAVGLFVFTRKALKEGR